MLVNTFLKQFRGIFICDKLGSSKLQKSSNLLAIATYSYVIFILLVNLKACSDILLTIVNFMIVNT